VQRLYRHMPNSYQWFERLVLGTLVPMLVANRINNYRYSRRSYAR